MYAIKLAIIDPHGFTGYIIPYILKKINIQFQDHYNNRGCSDEGKGYLKAEKIIGVFILVSYFSLDMV